MMGELFKIPDFLTCWRVPVQSGLELESILALRSVLVSGECPRRLDFAQLGRLRRRQPPLQCGTTNAIALCAANGYWEWTTPLAQSITITTEVIAHDTKLKTSMPNPGAYSSETDALYDADWKQTMYKSSCTRLPEIKDTYESDRFAHGRHPIKS